MRTSPRTGPIAACVAVLLTACSGPLAEPVVGPAILALGDEEVELAVTACTLVGGRLMEELPEGGAEVTVVAEGPDHTGRPLRVTARRGTDVVAPHRFELLEISRGDVEERIEVIVVLRGWDRDTGTWTQIDPDAPRARQVVAQGLFEIDGARLATHAAGARAGDGRRIPVRFEAVCPPQLERDPGVAAPRR